MSNSGCLWPGLIKEGEDVLSYNAKQAKIGEKEVDYVAELARLQIKPDEKAIFAKQLSNVLNYIEKLNQLDTKQIEPTAHILEINNVFREDVVKESNGTKVALKNAPQAEGDFFKVPKII